ncbi:isopentenyl-diphosphate delta-isomerase [Metabacillus malikii]|uniref:Isopentenyl-diphosphate delta-isomerase n=1 Tax=Metabacillus malikii TaxID=1504265 RepID=A0ABT9ZKW7_9BACI|nr:isopentenyl-diphosphate delta-isomerase [Metabacillus malikii]
MSDRKQRKLEHIQHALTSGQDRTNGFEDITFIHQSLPNQSLANIQLDTKIGELILSSPIFINAMTGGGGKKTLEINEALAKVAKETNIAMAIGSQMAAIKDKSAIASYEIVRKVNPKGIIFANIGSEATLDEAKLAIEMIEADALQIHINVVQELIMPEGDRDFTGVLARIEEVAKNVNIPIIVKEVGFGMNREVAKQLKEVGINIVDIGGRGGTDFAKIENLRRERMLESFNEWGIPTASSIAEVKTSSANMTIMATGGIQSALEVAKAISLGASAAGVAGYFLKILIENDGDYLVEEIKEMKKQLSIIMTALGTSTIKQLQQSPILISGKTHHWLTERNINTKEYSVRTMIKK